MDCPECGTTLPPGADPTQRFVECPECGARVDLATDDEGTRVATPGDETALLTRVLGRGRYRIDSLLGRGGMGTVYRGTQLNLDREVAIKVLSPELTGNEAFRRRFRREAGALAALDHPNIVTVHDLDVEDGLHYIVMAYVAGPDGPPLSLRELMVEPLEEELALRVVQQTCSALSYAHGRGIVHRDIKPGNILLDAQGNAKLADFGIARVAAAQGVEQTLTVPGSVMGTLRYMAPEQKLDAASADARSDLYSLGVVFYEMLTGQVPEGRFELPAQARQGLDPRLDGIVDRALRAAAEQRYQSAEEMARDLSSITTEREYSRLHAEEPAPEPAPARPPEPEPELRPPPPTKPAAPVRRRRTNPLPAILLLAAVGAIVWLLARDPANGPEPAPLDPRIREMQQGLLRALAEGENITAGDFPHVREDLPDQVFDVDLTGARAALRESCDMLAVGDTRQAVARIPEAVIPAFAERYSLPQGSVRAALTENLRRFRPGMRDVRDHVALGPDWLLLLYEYLPDNNLFASATQRVAIVIRERGRWMVLP
jgi:hypothetical protein